MFDEDYTFNVPTVNFPLYNIVKTGDFTYDVELSSRIPKINSVDYADNVLTVKSVKKRR